MIRWKYERVQVAESINGVAVGCTRMVHTRHDGCISASSPWQGVSATGQGSGPNLVLSRRTSRRGDIVLLPGAEFFRVAAIRCTAVYRRPCATVQEQCIGVMVRLVRVHATNHAYRTTGRGRGCGTVFFCRPRSCNQNTPQIRTTRAEQWTEMASWVRQHPMAKPVASCRIVRPGYVLIRPALGFSFCKWLF